MKESKTEIGIIVLAAGASTRMNNVPKQLLKFRGQTLIRRAAETALKTDGKVVVVLGANAYLIKKEILDLPLEVVINENWATGMGESIKAGLNAVSKDNLDAVIIMLCDQPFVSAQTIARLMEKFEHTGAPIVASYYNETLGVPALFGKELFADISNLNGEAGAKAIIKRYQSKVAQMPVPEAVFDVDTEADFRKLSMH